MSGKKSKYYRQTSTILANWAHFGVLPKCPVCNLAVVRIVHTQVSDIYVHAGAILCEVRR